MDTLSVTCPACGSPSEYPDCTACGAPLDGFLADVDDDMKLARRWLLWKSIPRDGGKPIKKPFYASGAPRQGPLDSDEDRARLATFGDACQAFHAGGYAGLGFALGPDGSGNCWQGVDLDNVPDRPELAALVPDLPGYTETSPSGTGYHAIGYGQPFDTLGSNNSGIEAYSSGRYFTVTGEGAGIGALCDLSPFVQSVLAPMHGKGKASPQGRTIDAAEMSVEPATYADLRSALCALDADGRAMWVKMGHALKTIGNQGRALWLEWSQTSEKYDPKAASRAWASFAPESTDYRAVFAEAQRAGWRNPMSTATPVVGSSVVSEEGRKLAAALAVIPRHATQGKHTAASLIGMALRHTLSGIDQGEGAALCGDWDKRTGGTSLLVFQTSDPDYCATLPITKASVYALAKEHGWVGEPDPEPWGDPLPIPSALLPVMPFDAALLPAALAPWVVDIAERMQCPVDFPAVGAMVALSSVIGRKACVRPKRFDDWQVTPNLWGVIVGRPGVMKSPALAEALRPLDRLAAIAGEAYKQAMRDHEIRAKLEGMSDKEAERKAQSLVKKGDLSGAERLLADVADAEEIGKPALRRYKVTDASVEALGEILIENPWGTLAYRDELHGLLRSLDKEGQEGARAFYLQGHDGNQSYTSDRILRGRNLHIVAVCLSVLGGIQPGKLQAYIHDAVSGGAGDDGLLQRFGLLVWPDVVGEWRNVDRWPDTDAKRQAFETFQRLDALAPGVDSESGDEIPAVYRFTDRAQDLFDEWRQGFETALRAGDHHPAMESHLAKYRKLVPAIALLCGLADGKSQVDDKDLLRALAWSEYLQTHAARAYAAGTRPETDGATALLGKIKAGAVADGFKPADVYLKGWSYLGAPEVVKSAAQMLCDLGHLRRVITRQQHGAGRPAISYQINPATLAKG